MTMEVSLTVKEFLQ